MTVQTPLTGPTPKHVQLREVILGMARPGEAIPSERDLCRDYGVSRATVRAAIGGLVADGMLQRVQGLGTFAVQPRLESRLHLASFTEDMRRRGLRPSTQVVGLRAKMPPPEVAQALSLGQGERTWLLERVRLADDEPIAFEAGWYPVRLAPDLDAADLSQSLYAVLAERYGLVIDYAEQTLWGEPAAGRLATLLRAPIGVPLLVFRRLSKANGIPVEHVVSHYRGDRYQVHMQLENREPS